MNHHFEIFWIFLSTEATFFVWNLTLLVSLVSIIVCYNKYTIINSLNIHLNDYRTMTSKLEAIYFCLVHLHRKACKTKSPYTQGKIQTRKYQIYTTHCILWLCNFVRCKSVDQQTPYARSHMSVYNEFSAHESALLFMIIIHTRSCKSVCTCTCLLVCSCMLRP